MSFEQRNKEYFDHLADSYESKPWQKKMVSYISEQLRASLDWIGQEWVTTEDPPKNVRLFDYACGPGTISRALGPYVSQTRGIDLSPAMVDKFNSLASEAGLPKEQIQAAVGNLLDDSAAGAVSSSEWFDFDVAAIGLGFHHFEQRPLMLKRIAERLRPGGVLLILDFLITATPGADEMKEWNHGSKHTISVTGFTESDMRELYDEAGLADFALKVFPEPVTMEFSGREVQRTLFLAKGRKK